MSPIRFRNLGCVGTARINRLPQIHIHPVAASDQNAQARIYQYGRLGSSTSHLPYPDETLDHVPSVSIQTVRLDDWVAEGRIAAPDLVKIDIEGHAFSALCGMRETLARHLPVIVFAVHDYVSAIKAVRSFGN